MSQAWIALGSNLGVSKDLLQQALVQLDQLPETRLVDCSPWYQSAPIGGPANQPDYLNAVCLLQTQLSAKALLHALHTIEARAGRDRNIHWGPRTLDLDIILYDQLVSDDPQLTLPHPRAHLRAFVLYPLADLNPELMLHDRPVSNWLPEVADQSLVRLDY